MNPYKEPSWRRLDNAAKIFPPNSNNQDTKVFRFTCRLNETVDPLLLQQALDQTMPAFPLYNSIIRKGLFWYYFETSQLKPVVSLESKPPCSRIYDENIKRLLFEVTYFKNKINLEIHHVLTDGVGALQFLRTLVLHYLMLVHKDVFDEHPITIDYDASRAERESDDFKLNYSKGLRKKGPSIKRAYKLKGNKLESNFLQVINGTVSVKEVLDQAHIYNTTLTVYLTSILLLAISKQMTVKDRSQPIVMAVPVNLRPYFQSASARNFFSVLPVPYYLNNSEPPLEDIISYVDDYFKKELTAENLQAKLNHLVALERNYLTRVIPLALKKPTLQLAHFLTNKDVTTSFSNIGKVTMPPELSPYIDAFDVCVSTTKVQVCLCSYQDKLSISFTSPLVSTEVQKHFFRELTKHNIHVLIDTNITD